MNPHDNVDSPRSIRVADASDLLAAVPAMLGFHPHRSMVLIGLQDGGTRLGPTMRHDLVLAGEHTDRRAGRRTRATPEMLEVIDFLAGYCGLENLTSVIAVFVDDRIDPRVRSPHLLDIEALVAELDRALQEFGVQLAVALAATEIEDRAWWWSLRGPSRFGRMSDPASSPLAVARVLDGYSVHRSRTELFGSIEPEPDAARRRVASAITRLRRDGGRTHTDELKSVLGYIARSPRDSSLGPREIAEVGDAISHVPVRDALLALTLGDDKDNVEQFWATMARNLPDCERSIAATLFAFSAYARGDGPMARIAIDAALECDETYSLAVLLDRSLSTGAGPELIREVAASGYACARTCGVVLPGDR